MLFIDMPTLCSCGCVPRHRRPEIYFIKCSKFYAVFYFILSNFYHFPALDYSLQMFNILTKISMHVTKVVIL